MYIFLIIWRPSLDWKGLVLVHTDVLIVYCVTETSTGGAVDVSGIDFDDDMTETDSKRSQGNRNYVTMDTDKENDSSRSGGHLF